MGKFDFDIPKDLTKMLSRMEQYDEIAPSVLNAASPIVEKAVKRGYQRHKRTGNLERSVKTKKPSKNSMGWMTVVRPTGKSDSYMGDDGVIRTRKEPVRNMEIAAYHEYGTRKMAASPVIGPAVQETRGEVEKKMQEIYETMIKRGG